LSAKYFIFSLAVLIIATIFLFPIKSSSQEMEPRNYSSIPVGLNALALNYAYSSGAIVTDATAPIQDLELTSNSVALGYLRSFGIFGKLCKIQVGVPFVFLGGTLKLQGRDTSGSRTGFADTRIKLIMNIVGTPALQPKDFAKFKEEFVFGTSVAVSAPTGLYYEERLINLGANRWGFKPEIGMSYNKGPFYFELFTGVSLFTKNSNYLSTKSLAQNPLFALQGNISYFFPSKIWIALNTTYVTGGETKVNGVVQNNFQKNFRSGLTLSIPINASNSIKATFSTGVATRAGGNFTIYSITYQYLWF
jgi:hypothetical protein